MDNLKVIVLQDHETGIDELFTHKEAIEELKECVLDFQASFQIYEDWIGTKPHNAIVDALNLCDQLLDLYD